MVSGDVPELVRVTFCVPLGVPMGWLAKVTVVGLNVTAGPGSGAAPAPTGPLRAVATCTSSTYTVPAGPLFQTYIRLYAFAADRSAFAAPTEAPSSQIWAWP